MSSLEFTHFADTMPAEQAEAISDLFARNYPDFHTTEDRESDIAKHLGVAGIHSRLSEGREFYVASSTPTSVVGFLESRTAEVPGGVYEQLSWVMVDKAYKGQRIASRLHDQFMRDATQRARGRQPILTAAQLGVHKQNPARAIYARWGYGELPQDFGEKVFMVKTLV